MSSDQDCPHCEHYQIAAGQLFDTAIDLDEAEGRLTALRARLRSTAEALVWCMAHLAEPTPAWIQTALDEAEGSNV